MKYEQNYKILFKKKPTIKINEWNYPPPQKKNPPEPLP